MVVAFEMELRGNEACDWVEQQGDGSGVLRRIAKVNSNARSWMPFEDLVATLQSVVEDVSWTSKSVKMPQLWGNS